MKLRYLSFLFNSPLVISITLILGGCFGHDMRSIYTLNKSLSKLSSSSQAPFITNQWLVTLVNRNGKQYIEMLNMINRERVALPGVNSADSHPISVSASLDGNVLAFVRQKADKTELLIYRRRLGVLQKIDLQPKGIPRKVSLDGSGRMLAVEVSRKGKWDIDLIRLR